MEKYNYLEATKNNIRTWLEDNEGRIDLNDFETIEDFEQWLNDELWCVDSITGNASGSYTFNTWEAEENLCHNLDLLGDALEYFDCDVNTLEKGAEWCDVTIRCYVIAHAITLILEENEEAFYQAKEELNEENED